MASNIFLEDTCQVRYYGVSGDKKTSLDQLFSHANPEKDTVIVLVDPHIWNLMQVWLTIIRSCPLERVTDILIFKDVGIFWRNK